MIEEPDIKDEELRSITARTLITAGQHDLIRKEETDHIASSIRGAREIIVKRATHTSYVVHSNRLAEIILQFTEKNGRNEGSCQYRN
ncbi:MAG: hypothetical protein LKE85_07915 [Lachnospiraceae bacterium]|jgi:pimeloyl-ACP methyl ester carboxylesterase|nr:hypothetical protein [Lachnospiraceae bacterium]